LWILVVGLFLPRLALFLAAFVVGDYPANPLPLLFNFVGWLFLPRFLIAYYVFVSAGTANLWFWIYIILGVAGLMGESGYVHRRVIRRRTTVTRDGNTTTTVEDEEV
jgi:hypothetical protein